MNLAELITEYRESIFFILLVASMWEIAATLLSLKKLRLLKHEGTEVAGQIAMKAGRFPHGAGFWYYTLGYKFISPVANKDDHGKTRLYSKKLWNSFEDKQRVNILYNAENNTSELAQVADTLLAKPIYSLRYGILLLIAALLWQLAAVLFSM